MNVRRAVFVLAALLGCGGNDRPSNGAPGGTPDALSDGAFATAPVDAPGSPAPATDGARPANEAGALPDHPDGDGGADARAPSPATDGADSMPRDAGSVRDLGAYDSSGTDVPDATAPELVTPGGPDGAVDSAPDAMPRGPFLPTGSMEDTRHHHTATLLRDGKVLVAGSHYNGAYMYLNSALLYDSTSGGFLRTGSMQAARGHHTATLLRNGGVLVTGGHDFYATHASAEIYEPERGVFSRTGNLTSPRRYHCAAGLNDGQVLVMGGNVDSGTTATAELFDPTTGTFVATGPMVEKRQSFAVTTLPNGKVLVVGGQVWVGGGAFTFSRTAELYDLATQTFTLTGSMSQARTYATVTLLANGKVLVAGGYAGAGTATAEIYDPALGTFSPTGSMATPRAWGHRANPLPTGKVLVTGGTDLVFNSFTSAELYDPTTGQFSPAGSMTVARSYHTATLLTDGSVLLAGGQTALSTFLSSAELYRPSTN